MSQPNPAKETYDRLAPVYDRRWRSYADATLQAVLEAVRCQEGEKLLDIPCGTGELERLLLGCCPRI
jgi:cyclopropane fatty-acyl-phospholipid synthase-like methyltransferase